MTYGVGHGHVVDQGRVRASPALLGNQLRGQFQLIGNILVESRRPLHHKVLCECRGAEW